MARSKNDEKILGQYHLIKRLGAGAAGEVHLAEHAILEQRYAVKVLHPRLAKNDQFTQRFLREARLAARLVHPNIVRVITADHDRGTYFLVMEYVEGHCLETVVQQQNGPLPVRRAVRYVQIILEALQYAHDQGMLHRDVKAENVLVDSNDQPRLVDFGLILDVKSGSDLTAHDTVVGTPYYMAPEQWRSEELDQRADVFSAGVLLYYLLTARFPFPGKAALQIAHRLQSGPHETLDIGIIDGVEPTMGARLASELRAIVDRALVRDRDQRYSSAAEFASDLRRWRERADRPREGSLQEETSPSGASSAPSPSSLNPRHFAAENEELSMSEANTNLETEYVEIADGTYWVGKRPAGDIFYANPYLRTFSPRDSDRQRFNLLIDPGSSKDFSVVQSKVSQVIGDIKNISSVFINHQDPDVGSSVGLLVGRYVPNAHVLCTEDTWRLVHYYNIPRKQFVPLEKYPRGIKLPSGDVVLPVPSPFCHFVGAMMLYDPYTRVLFSGDLFGGLTDRGAQGLYADESDWTGMRAFHQIYMPTRTAIQHAIDNIRRLDPPVEIIAPQHGRVIRGEYVQEYMERLYNLPVGLDILDDRHASEEELQAWTTVLNRVIDVARSELGDRIESLLDEDPNLSGHITFAGGIPEVKHLGKTSVERAVRLLCDEVGHATANSIKYEAVFAAEELGLPTPSVELDEDGEQVDSGPTAAPTGFDVA